jgi:hypothetical protein
LKTEWLKDSAGLVNGWIGDAHPVRCFKCCSNVNQRSHSDTWTGAGGITPGIQIFDEFGPEREKAALGGFGRMKGAAPFTEEVALASAGFTEAEEVAGPVDVAAFELFRRESEVGGGLEEVRFGQIDEALDFAAAGAAGLAGESERGGRVSGCGERHARFILNNESAKFKGDQERPTCPVVKTANMN